MYAARRIFLVIILMLIPCLPACGQSSDSVSPAASTEQPTVTIAPTITPVPIITPVPTTEPTPSPTPTPFSAYSPTVNMSFEELVGDNGDYGLPKGFPKPDTYRVIVDVHYQVVMVYSKDAEGNYTVPVRYMLCSTGKNGKTLTGITKLMNYRVRFSVLKSLGQYTQYWSQIYNRVYFHSLLYYEKDASTYVEDTYSKLGHPNTPACVYLTVPDARWIYYNAAPGTEIEIRKGREDDAETALIRSQLVLPPAPEVRPSIIAGEVPYTDNWRIEDVPADFPFVQGGQK
jgi:hypothetical protein